MPPTALLQSVVASETQLVYHAPRLGMVYLLQMCVHVGLEVQIPVI